MPLSSSTVKFITLYNVVLLKIFVSAIESIWVTNESRLVSTCFLTAEKSRMLGIFFNFVMGDFRNLRGANIVHCSLHQCI